MTDGAERPEKPGLHDLPRLFRTLVEKAMDLGSARIQLAQMELKEEVQVRLRRAAIASVFIGLFLVGFGLLNVGIVAWLAESIGVTKAAFSLAGLYIVAGLIVFYRFQATGGFDPPRKDADEDY